MTEIEKQIVALILALDGPLTATHREIAAALGVSQGTARRVLTRLSLTGRIVVIPRSGRTSTYLIAGAEPGRERAQPAPPLHLVAGGAEPGERAQDRPHPPTGGVGSAHCVSERAQPPGSPPAENVENRPDRAQPLPGERWSDPTDPADRGYAALHLEKARAALAAAAATTVGRHPAGYRP